MSSIRFSFGCLPYLVVILIWMHVSSAVGFPAELPRKAFNFLDNHCLSCHDSVEEKGDLEKVARKTTHSRTIIRAVDQEGKRNIEKNEGEKKLIKVKDYIGTNSLIIYS